MEKPPTLGMAPSEEFPTPTKGPVAASFLDDDTQAGRYLPTYLPLQPDPQSTVTQPGSGEPLAYSNQPLPEYYNESHLARSMPMGSDAARPAPFMEEQMMGATVASSIPFGTTVPVHRPSNEPDIGAPQYGAVPAYDGRGEMIVGDGSDHAMMYPRYDVMLSNPMNRPAARRGPFKNNDDREKTAQTRKIGSCVRCRMQRIRCLTNPGEPGGPCLTCQKVAANTKIRRLPCLRYKITDVRLFKPGQVRGFEWTRRWRDSIVDNISSWASDEVKVIHVSEGYTGRSVELRVRQFVPQDGDKLERSWVVNGVKKSVAIPPYAIVDLEAARKSYAEHIDRGIVECLTAVVKPNDDLLWKTYRVAWKMSQDPAATNDERELLLVTLRLWVAIRLTTKSTTIVGPETLGMQRGIMDETSPNHGSIPLPPVMGAQLDLILIHQIQSGLRRDLLDKLQKMIQTNKQKTWLTSYLVTFILLHNIALITDHDASYARKHGMKARFAREDKVKEYHMGANILLAYFHYCNKGIYPFSNDCKEQDLRSLAELDDAMMAFVRETRAYVTEHKTQWQRLQQDDSFEDDYFFVSQLFVDNWEPRTTV
ncbi:uncharacterized protein DNG_00269 [Cephalotrichum gorgonifer]|uniref:Zn(2)-C6 fungal-type domain-containing protein n=1 Tax=Cephalotrichum gorgonifer TaxID=2041049 RepID=A0AAE8MNM2_9PEZI|nr:uncharacterized protein DNG_00269 [Cephalotrichum gorgonifer]